mmetsp:Transcript_68762/g.199486  ORF Transcript_68762/g.199486 Transcript_68762/m.199486 type:complete len:552 (-) Transcript_68762:54-1709(-)
MQGVSSGPISISLESGLIVSATVLIGLLNLVSFVRYCLPRRREWWQKGVEHLRSIRAILSRRNDSADDGNAISKHFEERMHKKAATGMQEACLVFHLVTGVCCLSICYNISTSAQRWMSRGQTFSVLTGFAVMTGLRMPCMRSFMETRPSITYAFSMLILCSFIFTVRPSLEMAMVSEGTCLWLRVIASTRLHKVYTVVCWNLIYFFTVMCMGIWKLSNDLGSLISFQLWATVFVIIVAVVSSQAVREDVRKDIETATLRSESSGLWNLLDLVCDVVVSLDENLRITDKASRFSALVMLPGKNLERMSLKDLMPAESDREAFERCAASSSTGLAEETVPRAIHVKLRDGLGNLIPVELFCVQVQQVVGRTHFVGIREFTDFAPIPECKRFDTATIGHRRHFARRDDGVLQPSAHVPVWGRSPSMTSPTPSESQSRGGAAEETIDEGIQLALVRLMRLLSVSSMRGDRMAQIDSGSTENDCCPYHARVARIRACTRNLSARPCFPKFKSIVAPQCGMCGLLVEPPKCGRGHAQCFACDTLLESTAPELPRSL